MRYKEITIWKYRLAEDEFFDVSKWGLPAACGAGGLIEIRDDGHMVIRANYAWDGPSGPTIDTKTFMRGSLIHDALYQLIREGQLKDYHRLEADQILRAICREDGMNWVRAAWVFHSLRLAGGLAARARRPALILTSP